MKPVAVWRLTWRADPRACALADRHYSRKTPGSRQVAPPGRALVLLAGRADREALFVLSSQRYVRRELYPGAWVVTLFRNESRARSSALIREALASCRHAWGDPPEDGVVTFVDPRKVRPKRDFGRCFLRAGFEPAGETKSGLLVLRLAADRLPCPVSPRHAQLSFGFAAGSPSDDEPDETWDLTVEWVESRRAALTGWARRRSRELGVELGEEDVIQQAYLAAWETFTQDPPPEEPDRYFWTVLRNQFAPLLASAEPLDEDIPVNGTPSSGRRPLSDSQLALALARMRVPERKVWRGLLRAGGSLTVVAGKLGVSKPRVAQLRDAGLARVRAAALEAEKK
ncbi:MAG: hypothetical protein ACNS63_04255 [Candidatus Nitrospinota bacterium M3_3B_026]